MRKTITFVLGIVGGIISSAFGGWTGTMTTLAIFMGLDWLSGMVCAGLFKASDKTEYGGLSSKAGFKGLAKKCMIMLFVLIGARLDMTLGSSFLRDSVCIAFITNEVLSIIENAGAMGVPVPAVLRCAIESLQKDGDRISYTDDENGAGHENNA